VSFWFARTRETCEILNALTHFFVGTPRPKTSGEAVDYMDPLVYWLSDLLPLANSVGVLRSKFLLKVGMPFLRFLPGVPPEAVTPKMSLQAEDVDPGTFRREESKRLIRLPRAHVVNDVVFYVMNMDGRYMGEFRYSSLLRLSGITSRICNDVGIKDVPPFPGKAPMGMSDKQREERRLGLEKFLQFVMAEPAIVETDEFVQFIKQHRRWEHDLPVLASPLLVGGIGSAIPVMERSSSDQ
jgi:hypothetical protein